MKIAIDVRNIGRHRTGSEVVVRELTKHIVAIDRENEYFLLTDTDDDAVIGYIREKVAVADRKNVHIVSLCARNKFTWSAWHVWRWARKERIDIYHTEYIVPFFLPRYVKVLTHIHDVSFAALPSYIGKKDLFFLRLLIPYSLRRATRIIAISQFTHDEIIKYYHIQKEKIVIISNALPPLFERHATDRDIERVRARYNLPQKYIFTLGTMQPRKNIPFLIEAFARRAHDMPDIALVLSGKRGYHFDTVINETIARYGEVAKRIIFTGFVDDDDLPAVYAGADVFAFPSLYEGFGLPLLEAMSQDVLVVASDIPVFREVAGDAAIYADSSDLDSFANALYTMVMCAAPARARFVRAGRERVRLFSWRKSAQEMRALFAQISRINL